MLLAVLLLLVFTGTFFISVQNSRAYLEVQLQSHAQDAATSLGLSISPHMAEGDEVMVTSMVDAIFDRGYYRVVRVEDMEGKSLVDRVQPVQVKGVPAWFINALPLVTPEGEALVMAGWHQAGRVQVRSHPGFAYRQLWVNVSETLGWFLLSAILVVTLGLALLRLVLKPLKQVEWQAESICNREFPILEQLPRTRDLRRIVEAMNRMSRKVKSMLTELEKRADGLREQAHQHPVTGLANKRHFMAVMEDRIASLEECSSGVLCLIQLCDLKAYVIEHGYAAGDELLRQVASALSDVAADIPHHTLAHLSGGDFALMAGGYSEAESRDLGGRLSSALAGLRGKDNQSVVDMGHIGIVGYDGHQNASQLLAEADTALRAAQSQGANSWCLHSLADTKRRDARSATEWKSFIKQALADDRIVLHMQPVFTCPDKVILHREVLVRIQEEGEGELLAAGAFMPMAECLNLTPDIDRAVIRRALQQLAKETDHAGQLAINVSPPSLQSPGFMDWLETELQTYSQVADRVTFEISEYGAASMLGQVHELIARTEKSGSHVALDHFGSGFSSFAYLHSLKVHYLKVDGSYVRQMDENPDNQFFIQALAEIAHGLEMQLIAESVESEAVWRLLGTINVDGAQGYHLGMPQ
ncbi:GGDEF and EAL domain proteins [hydrothermal vent metagenome]|uniref:GGDEF and EAL domain proteins n=1 Tax=hydrothermal vent metagenome TaxID=652676 RepID=A0A3B1B7J5_9ZZZZ